MGSQSDIKYITRLSIQEQMESKLVKSILYHTSENKKYKFVFDVNGTLVERTYNRSFVVGDPNIEQGSYSKLAKIYRKDGSWRYGIVGFRQVEQTIGRELVSLYVKKLKNPYTRDWEWPGTLYNDAPDDTLGQKLNFYCDGMEKAVEAKDMSKLNLHFGTMDDYCKLYWFVNSKSNKLRSCLNRWIDVLPMGQIPLDLDDNFHSMQVEKLRYSIPPIGYEKWESLPPRFITGVKTQYVKSIYKDVKIKTVKKEVFYLDDLLMIFDPNHVDIEDETPDVVWNSLDETCRGNV